MPEQALEPFLLINCPSLLFPFLRRLVADLTREGGFPPLLLDPIDFAGLFVKRQQEGEQEAQADGELSSVRAGLSGRLRHRRHSATTEPWCPAS